jgi:ribonuclease PH
LNYIEDSQANVDMNIVMTGNGQFVELQGTGEESPFTYDQLEKLLDLGKKGVHELIGKQKQALGSVSSWVEVGE